LRTLLLYIFMLLAAPMLCAASPVFIDSRLLILAHPLFDDFDCTNGRFRNSSSEFVEGGQQGLDDLVAEIKQLNQWLLESSKHLQERLQNTPLPDRLAAERNFLKEKREVEAKVAMLQRRAYNARLVPGRPGITPDVSIYAQINQITADIRNVIRTLKKKYKTDVVIDVAELIPVVKPQKAVNPVLGKNLHADFMKGVIDPSNPEFVSWIEEADLFWARRLGMDASVIPYGAVDVRLEAIKMMEEITKGSKQ